MRTLLLITAAVCLPVLAQTTSSLGKGVNFYSVEKEIALGQGLAQEFERQARLFDDAAVEQYIQTLGARLTAQLPEDALVFPYTFRVTVSDDVGTHEPNSFPGGFIFVSTSLIAAAQDEAELAGMLAHAIGHVVGRHGTRAETRGQIANLAATPMIFMGGWTGYGLRQAAQLAIPLGFLTFARGFELDADKIAVQLLNGAGYDPFALMKYIERTQIDPQQSTTFSAMPSLAQRVARMRTAIEQLAASNEPAAPGFTEIQEVVRRAN